MRKPKEARITLRLTEEQLARAKAAAEASNISVNAVFLLAMESYLNEEERDLSLILHQITKLKARITALEKKVDGQE